MKRALVDSPKARARLVKWLESHATITLECLPEEVSFRGNASAIGPIEDAESEQWISDQLDSGNDWAWCQVKITVSWGGFTASDYLGCSSYTSEASFKDGGYYTDMVRGCCVDLVAQLFGARAVLDLAWEAAQP